MRGDTGDVMVLTMGGSNRSSKGGRGSHRGHRYRKRSGTGLIGPRVVGEPGRESEVLATAGVSTAYIAPPGASAVCRPTVALHCPVLVQEGEGGALAANVDIRGGRLGGGHLQRRGRGQGQQGQGGGQQIHGVNFIFISTFVWCQMPH